jgi:hypothetical protein
MPKSIKRDTLSPFGRRLADLMGTDTAKTLAKKLLDEGLVNVKYRGGNDLDALQNKGKNAIGAVEKKINKHLHAADPNQLQGEYVLAYCKHFNVSADYIFCRTDIKTPHIELRMICEITGLSEAALGRLIYHGGDPRIWQQNSAYWSRLINSEVYDDIEATVPILQSQQMQKARAEACKDVLKKAMKNAGGKTLLSMQEDMEGYDDTINSNANGISGSLFRISRDVSNVIERNFITPANGPLKDAYKDDALREIRSIYGKDVKL